GDPHLRHRVGRGRKAAKGTRGKQGAPMGVAPRLCRDPPLHRGPPRCEHRDSLGGSRLQLDADAQAGLGLRSAWFLTAVAQDFLPRGRLQDRRFFPEAVRLRSILLTFSANSTWTLSEEDLSTEVRFVEPQFGHLVWTTRCSFSKMKTFVN